MSKEMREQINRVLNWKEVLSENKKNIKTKVVDENGKPLIMYHGGSHTSGEFKGVGWFTTSKEDAEYLLKKANHLRQEQEDEVKRLNEVHF
jgi:hypothetical protein